MPKTQQTPASALSSLMEEYQLNPLALSKQIGLSSSSIRNIIMGKSGISVPSALRLSKFFGQDSSYWLNMQLQADMLKAANDKDFQNELKAITKAKKPTASAKPQANTTKTNTLAEKRKKAAEVPSAKPASRKPAKK